MMTLIMQATALETVIISPKIPARSSVIWLHGLGADGYDFVDIVPQLHLPDSLATRFIFPHAPIRPVTLNGGIPMRAWFDIFGLTAHSSHDEKGLQEANRSIVSLLEQERSLGIESKKIVLAGFSQGGALALYSGLQYSQPLAGIMGLSTYLPFQFYQTHSIPNCSTPIFLAHGTNDPILNYELGEASKEQLVKMGCPIEWHSYPMQHSVCAEEIDDIAHWLKTVLA